MDQVKYSICTCIGQNPVSIEVIDILKKFNCPYIENLKIDSIINIELYYKLWWLFISLSDLWYEKYEQTDYPTINSFEDLNIQFGYCLFL